MKFSFTIKGLSEQKIVLNTPINKIKQRTKLYFLMGDFNIDLMKMDNKIHKC